jgi:hypothetical protein
MGKISKLDSLISQPPLSTIFHYNFYLAGGRPSFHGQEKNIVEAGRRRRKP